MVSILAVLMSTAVAPTPTAAQTHGDSLTVGFFAGGELESYLRNLQLTGRVPTYPWSLRGFSADEARRLEPSVPHLWSGRHSIAGAAGDGEVQILAPEVSAVVNSGFAHGVNDREIWAGRGLTSSVRVGVATRWGPFSAVLAPVVYGAQNAGFTLTEHHESEDYPYSDWRQPLQIDHPQRPGDGAFARVEPGQSTLRVDWRGVAAGVSTANMVWGPASEYPLVVGTNAPGFTHVFAGTARPADVWIGDLHGRLIWGRLEESEYSPAPADSSARFMTGFVATFQPRGLETLELGLGRFFHIPWPDDGIGRSQILRPFETLLKDHLVGNDSQYLAHSVVSNQLMSVFGRWVLPRSGFELYGEFATDDHRHNLRDFLLEPDHNTAYVIGFRKAWHRVDADPFWVLRAEVLNSARSHLDRTRPQEPFYIHAHRRQGHTHRGQIIGSPAALGGGGATVAVDLYDAVGRQSIVLSRSVRWDRGNYLETGKREFGDVEYSLGGEVVLFRGAWDLEGGIAAVYDLNRDLSGDHRFNLNARVGARYGF